MSKIKLNLGCWHREIPGWIHIDICDYPHIDYKSSIDDLSMFKDNQVDLIYSSHSFEYFDVKDAPRVLNEWRRVLKPDGVLRLAVPNFDTLVELYDTTKDISKVIGPLFGRMEIISDEKNVLLFHKTVYNFKSLKKLLSDNGFYDVKKYDWKETIHKNFDDHSQAYFPHMDKENGLLLSLNVEAKKR